MEYLKRGGAFIIFETGGGGRHGISCVHGAGVEGVHGTDVGVHGVDIEGVHGAGVDR